MRDFNDDSHGHDSDRAMEATAERLAWQDEREKAVVDSLRAELAKLERENSRLKGIVRLSRRVA